jgi:hypothetical protein
MNNPIQIGIWGTSRAGKTVYLVALYWALQRMRTEWEIYPANEESEAFLDKAREDFFVHHRFPDKTRETKTYTYILKRLIDGHEYKLEFIDAPGELYTGYYDTTPEKVARHRTVPVEQRSEKAQHSDKTPQEMFDILKNCTGILVLLDPAWKTNPLRNQPYDQLLVQVFRDLKTYHRQQARAPYIALCYTKVDATDELWHFVTHQKSAFDSEKNCYRATQPGDTNPCAENCMIYKELGIMFMENQLELPPDHFNCYHISSIGRVNGEPNVGQMSQWEREEISIIQPPVFREGEGGIIEVPRELDFLDEELDEIDVDRTFEPQSVNKPNDINPFGVIDPLLWVIRRADKQR